MPTVEVFSNKEIREFGLELAQLFYKFRYLGSLTPEERKRTEKLLDILDEASETFPDTQDLVCIGCAANRKTSRPLAGVNVCRNHAQSVLWPDK